MRHLLVVLAAAAGTASAQSPGGFTPIFNGKDLTGWKATGKADAWAAEGGAIVCKGGGGGYLLTDKEYGDFELKFSYRWSKEGGNSGIALRTPVKGDPAYAGMEIQLIDDENWAKVHGSKLAPYQHTGSIYDVQPAKLQANCPIGEWNHVRVVCKGPSVLIEQNGKELLKADLNDHKDRAAKNHPGLKRDKGHIGFQSYNIKVEFKDVVVKELQ
ncbi:MAG TPA: DUF1080 domain-containing protein [Urbifossiella sp.]|nr:DUF1080 domain-containing protein [Urbifossiella sp.]